MRLFICVELEKDQLDAIQEAREKLATEARKGRFSNTDNIHLTLVFLGEVVDERLGDAIQSIENIEFEEFEIHMSGLGWFNKRSGKIYWVGFERSEKLVQLQKSLCEELERKGFQMEKREYTPHVTIGRNIKVEDDFNPWEYTGILQGIGVKV